MRATRSALTLPGTPESGPGEVQHALQRAQFKVVMMFDALEIDPATPDCCLKLCFSCVDSEPLRIGKNKNVATELDSSVIGSPVKSINSSPLVRPGQ